MVPARVYADFQNLDDFNRLRLTCAGTREDLKRQCIELRDGLRLTLSMDDADEAGRPDELRADGIVQFNSDEHCRVAAIDWSALRHASEENAPNSGTGGPCQRRRARRIPFRKSAPDHRVACCPDAANRLENPDCPCFLSGCPGHAGLPAENLHAPIVFLERPGSIDE
jgi:hypothetical protein